MLGSTVRGRRAYEILYDTQAQLRSRRAVRGDVLNREQGTSVARGRPSALGLLYHLRVVGFDLQEAPAVMLWFTLFL